MIRRYCTLICLAVLFLPKALFASGGTDIVASPGQPAHVLDTWPAGVGALVNDPARTSGWNSWFSEWPNDVRQYAMEVKTTDDLNRLIEKLAAVESDVRQIRLSCLKAPNGLGWVTNAPKDNKIPVIFSIGDQSRIDEWYKHVRKPFGVMEFTATPVAVPPTLTIFVQNEVVDLDKLKIPEGIAVSSGYVPTVFHRSNTTIEKKQEEEAARKPAAKPLGLDAASQAAVDRIAEFLKKRQADLRARESSRERVGSRVLEFGPQSEVSRNLLLSCIVQGFGTFMDWPRSGRIRILRQFTRDIDDAGRYLMSRTLAKGGFV